MDRMELVDGTPRQVRDRPMKSFFDAYGELARAGVSATEMSGRYRMQALAERRIVDDVKSKLRLDVGDRLLDLGCGPGNLLIPLSYSAAEAIGIDHPDVIAQARRIFTDSRIQWKAGRFPDVQVDGSFDCILAYSVIQYLPSFAEVLTFVEAGSAMLKEGGRFLVADIPNSDKKKRFAETKVGMAFEAEWRNAVDRQAGALSLAFDGAQGFGALDDAGVLKIVDRMRSRGLHAYVLPQPPDLPFGQTREDLLIVRP